MEQHGRSSDRFLSRASALAFLASVALAGCGGGGADAAAGAPAMGEDAGADAAALDAAVASDADAGAIDGVWAVLTAGSRVVELPVVGQSTSVTRTWLRVVAAAGADGVALSGEVCGTDLDTGTTLVQIILPDAFVSALAWAPRVAAFDGATLEVGEVIELRGVALASPGTDALPTTESDPRAVDQDHDGNPGMTLRAKGIVDGEMWVVERDRTSWSVMLAGDRLDGRYTWDAEQNILHADNPLLATPNPSAPDPDASHSYVRGTRVAPSVDCAAILSSRDALFARP